MLCVLDTKGAYKHMLVCSISYVHIRTCVGVKFYLIHITCTGTCWLSIAFLHEIIFTTPVNNTICEPNPCKNNGKCMVVGVMTETIQYVPVFLCDCALGYGGDICDSE